MDQSNLPAAVGLPLSAALFAMYIYSERLARFIRTHRTINRKRTQK